MCITFRMFHRGAVRCMLLNMPRFESSVHFQRYATRLGRYLPPLQRRGKVVRTGFVGLLGFRTVHG